jgi:hypothetical protein
MNLITAINQFGPIDHSNLPTNFAYSVLKKLYAEKVFLHQNPVCYRQPLKIKFQLLAHGT